MNFERFAELVGFENLNELERSIKIGYFLKEFKGEIEFDIGIISNLLFENGYSRPNSSRLKKKLVKTRKIIKGSSSEAFKLHTSTTKEIETNYPQLKAKSEEIISNDSILPDSLLTGTRGYLQKLALQINSSYENNIIDGCALLMRRLLEVLLILGFEQLGRKNEIQDTEGDLKNLSSIINYTISNKVFSMKKASYDCIDTFRKLGNFSAHRIEYNCRKSEIDKVRMEYRVLIEELLYKSNIKE